jgi:hypothetical protein
MHKLFPRAYRAFRLGLCALALAGSTLSQGCVQANADIPDMEVTRENLAIQPASSSIPAGMESTIVQQFTYEKSPSKLPKSMTSDLHAIEVTITIKRGAKDLSFIHAAKLTVTEAGGKPESVLEYQPGSHQAVGSSITLPLLSAPDSLNPWSVDSSTFELTITGILPRQAWYLDVTLSYAGSVSYHS